ncbi:porin family protein [Flavobacterium ardleyense]|uniref:Porin family protein n=1 Tax=Flavobacterium ardleyense TaxID=2038737 RepID=A0ABW5ZBK6_9FLAO
MCVFEFSNAQYVEYGLKAGLNSANLTGDMEGAKSIIEFHVGGVVEITMNHKFAFQPEILFSTQGSEFESANRMRRPRPIGGDRITVLKGRHNLEYLNIPLMLKYYVSDRFYIETGPQIGFLLSANQTAKVTIIINDVEAGSTVLDREDVIDRYKAIDFGANLGVGFYFTDNISASLRYNLGLNNISNNAGDYKVSNGVLQLSVGYLF